MFALSYKEIKSRQERNSTNLYNRKKIDFSKKIWEKFHGCTYEFECVIRIVFCYLAFDCVGEKSYLTILNYKNKGEKKNKIRQI